jgi:superoxide dismutase
MNENKKEQEEIIRQMMQSEMKKAPENLKFRIMHHSETEKALTPQKKKPGKESGKLLREMGSIFGSMYALLAAMVIGAYLLQGKDFLLTPQFIGPVVLVASVFSLFWLMTRLDDYLKERRK